jgi:anti-sigma B factor antagonist
VAGLRDDERRSTVGEGTDVAFSYTVDESGGVLRISLAGEIDMSVCDRVPEIVAEAVARRAPGRVEVDLRDLDFCDSSGISALFAAKAAAERAGCQFMVTKPHGMVRRVMEITGVLDALTGVDGPGV